jgi:molybdopterin converting factor small subunit
LFPSEALIHVKTLEVVTTIEDLESKYKEKEGKQQEQMETRKIYLYNEIDEFNLTLNPINKLTIVIDILCA